MSLEDIDVHGAGAVTGLEMYMLESSYVLAAISGHGNLLVLWMELVELDVGYEDGGGLVSGGVVYVNMV